MRQATFPLRPDADDFAASVDRQGWEAAYAALGRGDAGPLPGLMSLDMLREIVLKTDLSNWDMPDLMGHKAVLESDISIAIQWERDLTAMRGGDDAYSCYTGLTRDLDVVQVLFHGQLILQETLLTVKFPSRWKRGGILFVPLAHMSRRRWRADALSFALAGLVNSLLWREGYEEYMEASGVHRAD
jgi:hypothetical protein